MSSTLLASKAPPFRGGQAPVVGAGGAGRAVRVSDAEHLVSFHILVEG